MERGKYLVSLALTNLHKEDSDNIEIISNTNNMDTNILDGNLDQTHTLVIQPEVFTNSPMMVESEPSDFDDSDKDKDYQYDSDHIDSSDSDSGEEAIVQENMADEDINQENTHKGRPKKGRKLKFAGQSRNIRKKKCNSNEIYYTAKGMRKDKKQFIDFKCSCKNECHSKISVEDRRTFFSKYWDLANYNVQTTFLSTHVKEVDVKGKVTKSTDPNKRKFSRTYTISKLYVCRNMFVKTLNISTKRVNTSLCKVRSLSIPDKRGVAGGHNRMSPDKKKAVIKHINKFPRYKSHYCRVKKNDQEFLPVGITLPIMYKLYKDENENCVSLSAYRKIFLSEFNLKTKSPKKDTCNKCDTYQAKIQNVVDNDEKILLTSEHNFHLDEADCARKKMEHDLKNAVDSDDLETLTFDMEKTPPLPRLSTNIIFYKRQLWLYNCAVRAGKHNKSNFNIWIEGQAGRGAQEVGSCIRKYVKNHVSEGVTKLILWSDSCGGQNRNIKVVLLLKCILEENTFLESIQLRFLVSGHSFLPNDSDFGDVESALKRQQKLYSPQDYVDIMKTCRRKNPITVNFINKEDFVSTANIEKNITNRKKDINEEKINWLHIKEIKIVRHAPYSIFIKNAHNSHEDYKEINIKKKQGRPPSLSNNIFVSSLKSLWPNGKAVAQTKLDDIESYLHLIPAADQGFYKNLTGDTTIEEDIERFNGPLDFVLEEVE